MQITITLPAKCFNDDQRVRKPNGGLVYILKKKFPVYGDKIEVKCDDDLLYLVGPSGVNVIKDDKMLSADMLIEEAMEFLQMLNMSYS